jgi:hypothetical protein
MEIINQPGLIIDINEENGNLDIKLDPNAAPYNPPGFIVYEVRGKGERSALQLENVGIFRVESRLTVKETFHHEIELNNEKYVISLFGDANQNNFLKEIQVRCISINKMDYHLLNKEIFKVAIQTINNLSLLYQQPIELESFLILHFDLSVFTVIDQKQPIEEFKGILIGDFTHDEFFQHASDNYRKFLNSSDPINRYLSLYLCIDSIRTLIRKKLGVYPPESGRIIHTKYIEPVLVENFELNGATKRLVIPNGKQFYDLLYLNKETKGTLRNLRNTAAHTITTEGHIRFTDNLDDYLDYQSALPYLHHMYLKYLEIIMDLYK